MAGSTRKTRAGQRQSAARKSASGAKKAAKATKKVTRKAASPKKAKNVTRKAAPKATSKVAKPKVAKKVAPRVAPKVASKTVKAVQKAVKPAKASRNASSVTQKVAVQSIKAEAVAPAKSGAKPGKTSRRGVSADQLSLVFDAPQGGVPKVPRTQVNGSLAPLPAPVRRRETPMVRVVAKGAERTGSLSEKQLREIEAILLDEQRQLRRNGAGINDTLASERSGAEATGDMADASGDVATMESATLLASHTSRGLLEIESALGRLRSSPDKFGFCEVTGEPIPFGRLIVYPTARTLAQHSKK